jgi:hypothetical protein
MSHLCLAVTTFLEACLHSIGQNLAASGRGAMWPASFPGTHILRKIALYYNGKLQRRNTERQLLSTSTSNPRSLADLNLSPEILFSSCFYLLTSQTRTIFLKKSRCKPCMVAYTCNPSTWEARAGGSKVQSQPGLHSKFKASLGYVVGPYLIKKVVAWFCYFTQLHLFSLPKFFLYFPFLPFSFIHFPFTSFIQFL